MRIDVSTNNSGYPHIVQRSVNWDCIVQERQEMGTEKRMSTMVCKVSKEYGSRFPMIVVAAQRAHQLNDGARPKISIDSEKPAFIAIKEAERNLINYQLLVEESDEK